MARRPHQNKTSEAIVREYNALKKKKERSKDKGMRDQLQGKVDGLVDELNLRGLNTRGKPLKPQGYGYGTHCICSPAEKLMNRHRPNCPSA